MLGKRKNKSSRASGFSLVEVIVVVAIIAIVATIVIPRYQRAVARSNEASAIATLKILNQTSMSYQAASGSYANLQTLADAGALNEMSDFLTESGTVVKSGYEFQITVSGSDCVISGKPTSTGIISTGYKRFGSIPGGIFYQDLNNLSSHYTTTAQLTSGTSGAIPSD